jgi:hypothetical protein
MRATPGSGRDVRILVYWVDIRRIDADAIKRFVWGGVEEQTMNIEHSVCCVTLLKLK